MAAATSCSWAAGAAPGQRILSLKFRRPARVWLPSHKLSTYCRPAFTCLASVSGMGVRGDGAGNSLTQRILRQVDYTSGGAGGAGSQGNYEALQRADALWAQLRAPETSEKPTFVRELTDSMRALPAEVLADVDVAVCGGTLGIFMATALQMKGFRVAVVERGPLKGREQEWNISRKELAELVEAGVVTEEEIEQAIGIEFNPNRCGFRGGPEVWVRDVLNIGISPAMLIQFVLDRFKKLGGLVFECTALSGVDVHPDGVALRVTSPESSKPSPGAAPAGTPASKPGNAPGGARHVIRARLALDAMGNFSPIVRQMRWGTKPEGVCCVVGTCARGFREDANRTGDIIYSNVDVTCAPNGSELQYFWEAFPSGSGPTDRTTYLFAYLDAHPSRPSLEQLLDDYWRMLPAYQGVSIEELEVLRVLFGFFPSYKASPLPAGFDRILQIGDASGIQSPLSFGGFGSLTRHLARILAAVSDALEGDLLSRDHLGAINAYQPNLSSTWLYQRSMSVPPGDAVSTAAASLGQGAFASGEPIGGGGRDGRQQGLDNTGHYKSSAEGSGDQIGSQLMGGEARGQGDGAMVPASSSSSSSSSRGGGKGGFRGSFINDVLNNNFGVMKRLGDPVMMPFLQDVVEFKGLGLLMINVAISNPLILPALLGTLGIGPVIEWFGHFSSMGMYSVLHNTLGPAISSWAEKLSPEDRYYWRRRVEAWKFGSGSDYKL
eukprot:jgi/Mesvir1/7965/Mv11876-RA.1